MLQLKNDKNTEEPQMNETNAPQCLLLTPQSDEFRPLRDLIAETLKESGFAPILPEKTMALGAHYLGATLKAIERADLIIADVTGGNPNVMYEVGFAHAMRRPVFLIIQRRAGHIPFDLAGDFFLVYDPSKPDELRSNIQLWANYYLRKMEGEYTYA
jgi:hypothetical protein